MAPKVRQYESDIESTVAERAMDELGVFSIKLKKTQERGYPDRQFLIPGGRPLFIEFKRKGERAKPYQLMIHQRLAHAEYQVEVHDDIEKAMQAIRKAMDAGQGAATRREVASESGVGCAILRSGSRKNEHDVRSHKRSKV